MKVIEILGEIFEDVFAAEKNAITIETVPEDVEQWDSIGHMNLVTAMEEKFELSFEIDEVMEMIDLRHIVDILSNKGVIDS